MGTFALRTWASGVGPGVTVDVGVNVGVGVLVAEGVGVRLGVSVGVTLGVSVGVRPGVSVGVDDGVGVGVHVAVGGAMGAQAPRVIISPPTRRSSGATRGRKLELNVNALASGDDDLFIGGGSRGRFGCIAFQCIVNQDAPGQQELTFGCMHVRPKLIRWAELFCFVA